MATNTEEFTDTTEGGPQRLADAAGDIAQQATSVAEQRASSTMTQVGDTLEQVADAVRNASENLRGDQPQLAGFADTAAQQVERAAEFLRERDAREVINGAQDFARRQPAVVVGAGLALGLLVGRALKSASGSAASGFSTGEQWNGSSRYGAPSSSQAGGYGTPVSDEVPGGYGASDDYTGGAAPSLIDREGDLSSGIDTTEEGR